MPLFRVHLLAEQKELRALRFAPDMAALKRRVEAEEWQVVSITPAHAESLWWRFAKPQEQLQFLVQLLSAGLPLVDALTIVAERTRGRDKIIFQILADAVSQGFSLGHALACFPQHFDQVTCGIITAAQESGTLTVALGHLIAFQDRQQKALKQLKRLLLTPCLMIIMLLVAAWFYLTQLVPLLEETMRGMQSSMAAEYAYLFWWSRILNQCSYVQMLFGAVLLISTVILFILLIKKSSRVNTLLYRFPLVGFWMRQAIVARIFNMLSVMLEAGIDLQRALRMLQKLVVPAQQQAIDSLSKEIEEGIDFDAACSRNPLMRGIPEVPLFVSIGLKSNQLAAMTQKLSTLLTDRVLVQLEWVVSIAQPIALMIVGVLVALMLQYLYLPLMQMPSSLGDVL